MDKSSYKPFKDKAYEVTALRGSSHRIALIVYAKSSNLAEVAFRQSIVKKYPSIPLIITSIKEIQTS